MENNKLYPYQELLVKKSLEPSMEKGRIILPTASGKGVICREIIYRMILSPENKFNQFLGIIFTPRLLLNKQWINDFKTYFEKIGKPYNFALVGSLGFNKEEVISIEEALYIMSGSGVDAPCHAKTTKDLREFVESNKRKGINTIVISTYHSNGIVRSSGLVFDCAIFDEAHYLPGREPQAGATRAKDELFEATEILAKKKIFTTATEKLGDDVNDFEEGNIEYNGRGMENEDIYGAEIFGWEDKENGDRRVSPFDLIKFGSILEPRVYVITDNDINEYHINDLSDVTKITPDSPLGQRQAGEVAKVTLISFEGHRRELKKESDFPERIGAKMLVVCDGVKEMEGIQKSKEIEDFKKKNPKVKFYFISCETGIDIHGQGNQQYSNKSKKDFLDALNNLSSEDEAIIYHIDILTCGIDVPALTGVLFFKECKLIKLLQNIGRGSRLHIEDRIRWEKGEIKPGGNGYIKPSFHVLLPILKKDTEDFVNVFVKTINRMRDHYYFKAYEFLHIGATKEPGENIPEDRTGIKTPLTQLKDEAGRKYYEWIEDKKNKRKEREILEKAEQLKKWIKKGEWIKIKEYRENGL
jgi:hypothetical protein